MKFTPALGAIVGVAACQLVSAQSTVTYSGDGRPNRMFRPFVGLNNDDSQFLTDAAIVNMTEIQMAKVASERATSDFTKEFAKEMMIDHSGSLEELRQIARQKGVSLPSELPQQQQATINFLSTLSGNDFDAAYRRTQLMGHDNASIMLKAEIDNGRDEDVKNYAVMTLPTVTLHEKLAEIERTMMGPTKEEHGI
jgi:putative membrane protein